MKKNFITINILCFFSAFMVAGSVFPSVVLGNCTVTTLPLSFGTIVLPSLEPTTSETRITINCTTGTPYAVAIDGGNNYPPSRMMVSGNGGVLVYRVYKDIKRTVVWGDGTSLGDVLLDYGTAGSQQHIVYADAVPSELTKVGSYSDDLTVTVAW